MKLGWHLRTGKFHITTKHRKYETYSALCTELSTYRFLDSVKGPNYFLYPNGSEIPKNIQLSLDTVCKDCQKLYKGDFTFDFIKLKLGIK